MLTRPRLARSLTVAALSLGLALSAATSPATAAPDVSTGSTGSAGSTGLATADDPALSRAAEVLDDGARPPSASPAPMAGAPAGRVDASIALRDLFLARPSLDRDDADEAAHLLARPSDGANDPYGDGYTVKSTKKCSKHYCVHWVRSSADRATDAWAKKTLTTMEQVWSTELGRLNYRRPPGDGKRGGNNRFDVYLKELGSQGLYGYCAPERRVRGNASAASSFCVLDNDFSSVQFGRPPAESLRVTAAHEFFHAVQFGYDYREDRWLLENTATWMEERFADSVNDNRSYLRYGQLADPSSSLDVFAPNGFNQYANFTFWEYLSQRYGVSIVRSVWNRLAGGRGNPNDYSAQALRKVLGRKGGLTKVFANYASGNVTPARTYAEGSAYPAAGITNAKGLSPTSRRWTARTRIDHLASKNLRIVTNGSANNGTWRLRIKIDAPKRKTSPAAVVLMTRKNGSVMRRGVSLNANGFGKRTIAIPRANVKHVTVTLANASTRYRCRKGTNFACSGRPLDQKLTYRMTAQLLRR